MYYSMPESNGVIGGFQLEFVSISRVINHKTCYKFELLVENLFLRNPLQDLLSSLNVVISTKERN